LLNRLTQTFSEVAAYEFTTLTCIPGVIQYKGARIQLLDLPGIIEGAKDGKGRGKQVIAVARTCNLLLIVLDSSKPLKSKLKIMNELEGFGIRLNKQPPSITFKRKDRGGVVISNTCNLTKINEDIIRSILAEYKISNAEVCFKCNATPDDLIDVIEGNRTYCPALYVLNKIDQITLDELHLLSRLPHAVPISGMLGWNCEALKEKIWDYLELLRLYTKPRGQQPDYDCPVVIRRDKATVEGFCNRIHRKILEQFKYAVVWGTSVKHNPQRVGKDHVLADEDVVQIVKRVSA
jgi:small GTP-binding protein